MLIGKATHTRVRVEHPGLVWEGKCSCDLGGILSKVPNPRGPWIKRRVQPWLQGIPVPTPCNWQYRFMSSMGTGDNCVRSWSPSPRTAPPPRLREYVVAAATSVGQTNCQCGGCGGKGSGITLAAAKAASFRRPTGRHILLKVQYGDPYRLPHIYMR